MNNKKLIFIVSCPRSGSTLLLSYLCGILNTKVLYETKIFSSMYRGNDEAVVEAGLQYIADYFDSFEEEIVIEKTPEHCLHLEDIERLRGLCKRNIYVVYIIRPPIPTILSIIKASKDSPELFGNIDLQGACEKYEESLVAIYNNLILKSNQPNSSIVKTNIYSSDKLSKVAEEMWYSRKVTIPYSFCISYRELIENPYKIINTLLNSLYIEADVESLINNRISNVLDVLSIITTESHHKNVLRDIEEVEVERRSKISKQINEGFTNEYIKTSNYIRDYFEHPKTKKTVYDLILNKKVLRVVENPLVTIIVPLYNKERYILETLNSILNQTYQNLRIVVIDDASTDKSLEIVEEYYNSLSYRLQEKLWILKKYNNQGVSHTRNLGLNGYADIYSFCDADDIWDKTLVEKSIKIYEKYPYIDCVYSRVLKDKEGVISEDKSKICNGHVFKDAIQYNFLGCGSNLFVKASIFEENEDLRFDESYSGCEDWDFLIQLSKVAVFKCTKEYLVTYRQVKNSLSSNAKNQFDQGRNILGRYIEDREKYKRLLTRLFFFYLSHRNFTWDNIKELDFRFILEILTDKLKSRVKSYLS
jgi:glycosyltransferase involved in cell wall biosynthesis